MSSYRRYYLPSVSWSDVKGGVWRIQPYNVTDYFFIFRVQNLLTSANGRNSPTGSYEKQAGWVENGRAGENPQPEGKEKQVGWVENGGTGENPQPEATEKQAGWVESGRARETPQPEATRSSAR